MSASSGAPVGWLEICKIVLTESCCESRFFITNPLSETRVEGKARNKGGGGGGN